MPLERFSAAWREDYVTSVSASEHAKDDGECVFCALANDEVGESTGVLFRTDTSFVTLNAFPYGSGHLLVLPRRHVATLQELRDDEYTEFFWTLRKTVVALEATYGPDGMNVGLNLGHAAGAGIPKHLHAPRAAALERGHQLHDVDRRNSGTTRIAGLDLAKGPCAPLIVAARGCR